jgi:hypothetical protein
VGWIGQEFGARWSLVVGGVPTVLCGILAYPALAAIDRKLARRHEAAIGEPAAGSVPQPTAA